MNENLLEGTKVCIFMCDSKILLGESEIPKYFQNINLKKKTALKICEEKCILAIFDCIFSFFEPRS